MLRSEKGVSLVEIMIAMILFTVGLSVAMQSLPRANVTVTRARNITKATNLGQQKLESLMSMPYNHADLGAGDHDDPDNPIESHFYRRWNVQVDAPLADMKTVSVTVRFETASNDSSVTLTSLLSSQR